MACANLEPTYPIPLSEGTLPIAYWLHRDDQGAEMAKMRLLAMSVAGVRCEQLLDIEPVQSFNEL